MKINMNIVWSLITIFCLATWGLWFLDIDIREINLTDSTNDLLNNSNPLSLATGLIPAINPTVFDCESDWGCFQEKLLFCEKAKVSTHKDLVPYKLKKYISENRATIEIEKSKTGFFKMGDLEEDIYYCYTILTNAEGGRLRCQYLTNQINTDEKKITKPMLFQCNQLR